MAAVGHCLTHGGTHNVQDSLLHPRHDNYTGKETARMDATRHNVGLPDHPFQNQGNKVVI